MIKICITAFAASFSVLPVFAGDIENGQDIYQGHCAVCHGENALGDGPMAPAMMIKPKNLTLLSIENDGVFPLVRTIKRIDGREELISHGSPMPVYGNFFEGESIMLKTKAGQPIMTSQPIDDLISWMKSVQK